MIIIVTSSVALPHFGTHLQIVFHCCAATYAHEHTYATMDLFQEWIVCSHLNIFRSFQALTLLLFFFIVFLGHVSPIFGCLQFPVLLVSCCSGISCYFCSFSDYFELSWAPALLIFLSPDFLGLVPKFYLVARVRSRSNRSNRHNSRPSRCCSSHNSPK